MNIFFKQEHAVKQFFTGHVLKTFSALVVVSFALIALAQNTIGGTTISNTALINFTDSGGMLRTAQSNTVTTIVQTVYSFNVEPDDSRNPAATPNFAGYSETDALNDKDVNASSSVSFAYTVVSNTNNDNTTADGDPIDEIPVTLSVVQDTADNFDLTGLSVEVYSFTDTNANGVYDEGTDTLGAVPLATGGASVTYNFQTQGEKVAVIVTGTVPSTRDGNDIALIDLRATNDDAPVDTTATGANVYYENQNVARVEVNEVVAIGAAKDASFVNNGDGTYDVTYTIYLENFSNVALSNVQVSEDLASAFAGVTAWSLQSVTTSAGLTDNSGFTGTTAGSTNLLASGNSLARNGTGTITVVVRVTPGSGLGPYSNQVTVSGSSPDGTATSDLSDSGTDPDPDGDNTPNESGENDMTSLTFTEDRGLGIAKTFSTPTSIGGGVFETTLTFNVKNLSDATNGVVLSNVQITDNLTLTFPSPATYTVQSKSVTAVSSGSSATINSSFNGNTTQTLLASGTLTRQGTATIEVVVRFDPNGLTGPFFNQATVTGTTPQGTVLTDLSDNGTNPDQDGDGWGNEQTTAYDANRDGTTGAGEGQVTDPNSNGSNNTTTDENDMTPITFTETPLLGVAKRVVSVTGLTGANRGLFDAVFEVTLENMGDVDLNNVQATDDLSVTFAAPATVVSVSGITSALAENTGFDGTSDKNLLLATDTLTSGQTETLQFTVRFDPNGRNNITNAVTASATSPGGTTVNDTSTEGTDPDGTDNDNNPDENTTTHVTIPELPELGVAMAAATPVNNNDGTYTVVYTVTVENLGNVDLNSLQVSLPFTTGTAPFIAAQLESASITGTTGGLTANGTYNGEGVNNLLSGTNGLAVGSSGTITISVVIRPGTSLGSAVYPYEHNAIGTALSPASTNVSDDSTDGVDTDTDTVGVGPANNLEANDDSEVTPVFFTETPRIGLAKAATPATDAPGFPGEFNTTLTFLIENLGDVPLSNVQATDDLDAAFGAGNYTVTSVSGTGSNSSFDGDIDQNLVAASQSLAIDTRLTVIVVVRFNPRGAASPFSNTATATATSTGGATISDTSTNGNDTDPDTVGTNPSDNLDASDDSVVTPIIFTERPSVGIAKASSLLDANTDGDDVTPGPYSVRFDFTLVNLGNVALTNVQITEDLVAQLGGATNYTITSAPAVTTLPSNVASSLTLNPGFDGDGDTSVLGAGSTLTVADSAVISVTVRITNPGAYTNQVTATASGPAGRGSTTDLSDSGSDPDANGDGDGDDIGESDATAVNLDAIQVVKRQRICDDANCAGDTTIPVTTSLAITPGNYIEYTIVGTNVGGQTVTNLNVMDAVPAASQYAASTRASTGIQCTTDAVITGSTVWTACPTTGSSTTIKHTKRTVTSLSTAGTTTFRFVVFIP
jgi:uncharacterized repeat protein (TIGR01451 family)